MKYVESDQGGQALKVLPAEYDLAGRAIAVGWSRETPNDIPKLYERTDVLFAPLALDGPEPQTSRRTLDADERMQALRGIATILSDASLLVTYRKQREADAPTSAASVPLDQQELLAETELWTNTAASDHVLGRYRSGLAMDIAEWNEVVLAPWASEVAVSGLRVVAASHGLAGIVRRAYDFRRRQRREPSLVRKGAVSALRALDT